MEFVKDADQANLVTAEMVTIIGTGKSKHLPEGVEIVEEKGMADLLIENGAAVLKDIPVLTEGAANVDGGLEIKATEELLPEIEAPVIPAEPIVEEAPLAEIKEEPATGNVADENKNAKEKKAGKK